MTLVDELPRLRRLPRQQLQAFLPQLSAWLLPGSSYAVEHTWPQLYRSDGRGEFLGLFEQDRLVSHLAWRQVVLQTAAGPLPTALLGSVATAPDRRGRGHAGRLLQQATADCRRQGIGLVLLWAEQPQLYARAGFAAGATESCALLLRRPLPPGLPARLATVADHAQLHALHQQKPLRVDRSGREMSGLLTTPGMTVTVLGRGAEVLAYACCGKGADLQGWWHEFGGSDEHVARLLLASMHLLGQTQALVIVPPYRQRLLDVAGAAVAERFAVAGPMQLALGEAPVPRLFVDGLDSV